MTTSQHNQEYVIIMITTIKKNVVNEAVRAMSVHLGAHGLTLGEKLGADMEAEVAAFLTERCGVTIDCSQGPVCEKCGADLTQENAVVRRYVNKDDGEDAFSEGHYTDDMTFEPDSFGGSLGERYDCLDDSDSCASCEAAL